MGKKNEFWFRGKMNTSRGIILLNGEVPAFKE
jgi:hypothetical protein